MLMVRILARRAPRWPAGVPPNESGRVGDRLRMTGGTFDRSAWRSPMKWVSLVAWVATAGVGIAMAALWLERGGMRQTRLPHSVHVRRLATHVALAVSGLLV